jgi:hypothetical protein
MLAVVVSTRLCHPPRCIVPSEAQRIPDFEHPVTRCLRLGEDHAPRLTVHSGKELSVEGIDVDVFPLVRAGPDSFELDTSLGQPHPEMGDKIDNGPVRVAVIPGPRDLDRIKRMNELNQLVPSGTLGFDLRIEGVPDRDSGSGRAGDDGRWIGDPAHREGFTLARGGGARRMPRPAVESRQRVGSSR